ncbi:MAG TPA: S8 family serine peptidase, partial [Gemmatimonadota bacterium]|nr:S8 family serine peptidase [Gemmatimonadota bacterium]
AFTSYGKADVYADGYEVESRVPGGQEMRLSGTSMAAPQVVNLAGKLLAVDPGLTVAQLRHLIVDGADPKTIGGTHRIRLLDPKRSLQMLSAMQEGAGE